MDFSWTDWVTISIFASFGALAVFYAILLARS